MVYVQSTWSRAMSLQVQRPVCIEGRGRDEKLPQRTPNQTILVLVGSLNQDSSLLFQKALFFKDRVISRNAPPYALVAE